MPATEVDLELDPRTRSINLAHHLPSIDNTVQYSWLQEIARTFYHFSRESLDQQTIGELYDRALHDSDSQSWDRKVWDLTRLEAVFLTNDFDDPLEGWDTSAYVPCLRTDDLVLKLHEPKTIERLRNCAGVDVQDADGLRDAIGRVFECFVRKGARACAISLPPDFVPRRATSRRAVTPIRRAIQNLDLRPDEHEEIRTSVFWMLCEFCSEFRLPFDLMIGPVRNVYPTGVSGGRDLFDRRVSLYDYRELFNYFSTVTFPISTLAPDAGAELVAYSWIFPNVLPMGHWWYSNVPEFIAADLRARIEALPKVKLLGYYSDAYKLEFILPKFNMYRRILAETLADECLRARGWPMDRALQLGRLVLLDNPRRVFAVNALSSGQGI
jgi:glucuronate isomerase